MPSNPYPAYKVHRLNGHASYYLIASPTNCVEFVEERQAGNEFGFLIRTLKSRTVVKQREQWSESMDKAAWFAEVKASMLAHLDCAMEMVALCQSIQYRKTKPTLADYANVAQDASSPFGQVKGQIAHQMLAQLGAVGDASDLHPRLGP